MAFALSGTTITQSDSDSNLTGLAAITGVSTTITARGAIYNIGGNKLVITGDCIIAADEKIEIADTAPGLYLEIASGGSLTINGTNDGNTTTSNIGNAQVICDIQSSNHWTWLAGIAVSGTLNLQGGMIDIASPINFLANSTFRARGGVIKMRDAANGFPNLLRFAMAGGGTIDIDDFILFYGSNAFELSDIAITSLAAYSPRNAREGVMKKSSKAAPLRLENYNPENCAIDTSYIATGCFYTIYGMADKAPSATVHFDHASAGGGGITEIRKVVNITLADGNTGLPVADAAIFASDTQHACARDYSDAFYTNLVTGEQILTQTHYSATTDASGHAQLDKLLAFVGVLPGEHVGKNSGAREVLYKSKAADHNYADDFYVWSYAHLPATISNIDMTGLGEATIDWLLFADVSISEVDAALVDAYSEIDTAAKLYDVAKLWLVDNYAGETDTIVSRSGESISTIYNIIIDADAAEGFGFDGESITIKADAFSGNISTSGTVTTLNGAHINGAVEDATGVRVVVQMLEGNDFNIVARSGTAADGYTYFPFQEAGAQAVFTVAKGTALEIAMWSEGYKAYARTVETNAGAVSFTAELTANHAIDLALDVSAYLDDLTVESRDGLFTIILDAPMTVPSLEHLKAIIHRIVGREIALMAMLPPASTSIIEILSDRIKINAPVVRMVLGDGVGAADIAEIVAYIDIDTALALDSSYVLNPFRASDNRRVDYLRVNPLVDVGAMALAVRDEMERTGGLIDATKQAVDTAETNLTTHVSAEATQTREAVNNMDVDSTAIAAAVRDEMERTGGLIDATKQAVGAAETNLTTHVSAEATQTRAAIDDPDLGGMPDDVTAIKTVTDSLVIDAGLVHSHALHIADKAGYALDAATLDAIAAAVLDRLNQNVYVDGQ